MLAAPRIRARGVEDSTLLTGFTSGVTPTQSAERVSRPCEPRCRPEIGVPGRPRAFSPSEIRRSHCALRSGAGLKTGVPSRRRGLSWPAVTYRWRGREWWRRRESNPRPKVFCNDVYMHIRVVGGNPRPKAPFPLSVPHRINPANRGSEPIPCAHRRLGKTAGKARLGRRPFPPGRRGQEERGYLSSQCQFSVGFCFVSTVYERWTPDMQSLLHIPSSNPVRPPSSRDLRRQVRS